MEDNLRFVIPETCLALTIFREQLGVRVVALFALVLFSKFFHWVMAVRVEQVHWYHGAGTPHSSKLLRVLFGCHRWMLRCLSDDLTISA